jgi:predicted nucleic acid-binding protein
MEDVARGASAQARSSTEMRQLVGDLDAAIQQVAGGVEQQRATAGPLASALSGITTRSRAWRPQILALVNSLKRIPYLRIIHIDPALDDEAWSLLERQPDKDWSLVDAASFVVMRHLSIAQAFTTDQHFVQVGFVRLPER